MTTCQTELACECFDFIIRLIIGAYNMAALSFGSIIFIVLLINYCVLLRDFKISIPVDILLEKLPPGPFISDHCIVSCPLNISKPKPTKKLISFRKYKSIDIEAFKADLRTSTLVTDSPADLDDLVYIKPHLKPRSTTSPQL